MGGERGWGQPGGAVPQSFFEIPPSGIVLIYLLFFFIQECMKGHTVTI